MRNRKRAIGALLIVAALLGSLLGADPAVGQEAAEAAEDVEPELDAGRWRRRPVSEDIAQKLDWTPCYAEVTAVTGTPFECETVLVPLDYDEIDLDLFRSAGAAESRRWKRRGDAIEVALVRIPAADPANRQGAILVNPGGPGGSGINFVLGFGPLAGVFLGPEVPARFDLVGFDPRGIGQSTPIRCFDTVAEAVETLPPVPFPLVRSQDLAIRRDVRALARACRRYDGARRLGEHMSTANVARDMDVIRASMGDESLNFLGLSYGTFIVANYANLFPERVRSVVADGVLDPVAWVNRRGREPFSTGLRSDEGAAETLEEFFTQCEAAAPGNCAFAPDSRNRYDALATKLREDGPIDLPNPFTGDVEPFAYQDLIGFSLGNLYNPFGYADMAGGLAFFEAVAFGSASAAPPPPAAALAFLEAEPEEPYENFVEGFPAVACVDTDNPRSFRAWARAAEAAEASYGYFGPLWTWASVPCARWPFRDRDRYTGPFTAKTANPVLVIGNFYDPATRYEGAQTLRRLLPNSGLLSVDVPGHTSLGSSLCAGTITGRYFLDPGVAAAVDGFTCPAEFNVFDVVAQPPASAEAGAAAASEAAAASGADLGDMIEVRATVLPEAGLVPPALVRPLGR